MNAATGQEREAGEWMRSNHPPQLSNPSLTSQLRLLSAPGERLLPFFRVPSANSPQIRPEHPQTRHEQFLKTTYYVEKSWTNQTIIETSVRRRLWATTVRANVNSHAPNAECGKLSASFTFAMASLTAFAKAARSRRRKTTTKGRRLPKTLILSSETFLIRFSITKS